MPEGKRIMVCCAFYAVEDRLCWSVPRGPLAVPGVANDCEKNVKTVVMAKNTYKYARQLSFYQ